MRNNARHHQNCSVNNHFETKDMQRFMQILNFGHSICFTTNFSNWELTPHFEQSLKSSSFFQFTSWNNRINVIFHSLFICFSQIQLYGFNKELYHNMSEAQHKSQGIVGISVMIQIGETPNAELRIITSTFNKVLYRGKYMPFFTLNEWYWCVHGMCIRLANFHTCECRKCWMLTNLSGLKFILAFCIWTSSKNMGQLHFHHWRLNKTLFNYNGTLG